ncbi:hypothetical protein [Rubrivivax sp. JA1026]|uniref:hypothetical protein n=1 Tax=Rubrivivax sp. JA1026 TaxID=2710888 RepID=UPI0013E94B96|nr:hypothetical protein [Rubrivivax sp. JA1026]
MNLADETCREQLLRNGPCGAWRALPGSHTALMDEAIVFVDDGEGEMRLRSVLRGESRLRFRWRLAAYGVVQCQPRYDTPLAGDDGLPEDADWFELPYEFRRHATDAGSFWVLQERGTAGFWEIGSPLVPA